MVASRQGYVLLACVGRLLKGFVAQFHAIAMGIGMVVSRGAKWEAPPAVPTAPWLPRVT